MNIQADYFSSLSQQVNSTSMAPLNTSSVPKLAKRFTNPSTINLQKGRPINDVQYKEGERKEEAREPIDVYRCLPPVAEGVVLWDRGRCRGPRVHWRWEYVLEWNGEDSSYFFRSLMVSKWHGVKHP